MERKKVILALGGSSGSIYAYYTMQILKGMPEQWQRIGVVCTDNAIINWELEIGKWNPEEYPFDFYQKNDFFAPFASGSARYDTMIVIPCSMGLLGRINAGISDDLITRAADVVLKERRKLIIVPRETPLSSIHLRNMLQLTEAGAIICPAIPSFYLKQDLSIENVAKSVVHRVLDLAGFQLDIQRWND